MNDHGDQDAYVPGDPAARILQDLNDRQREAVTHGDGPLLIIAGAGTGKTNVVTRRIAYLIAKQMAKPDEILALTFTEKAASEMEERVDRLVPYGYAPVWISTFHAFGDRILRRHALDLGLPLHFDVLDELQQKIFLLENLWNLPLKHYRPVADPTSFLDEILKFISRCKDEDVTPEEYTAWCHEHYFEDPVEREKNFELAAMWSAHEQRMHEKGFLDFGDQVALTVRLLRKEPRLLDDFRRQFRYIMVDEFQDTNFIQFQLLQLLANNKHSITVVGDDDQSIYKFRGASLSNILNFSDIYPDCRKVVLTENYRSGQKLLDTAYRLIQFNNPDRLEARHGLSKRLTGRTDPDSAVIHRRFPTLDAEAEEIALEIGRLVREQGCAYRDIAILLRKNKSAQAYLESLRFHGIPFHFAVYERLFRRPEILWLVSLIHVLTEPHDSVHLFNLLASPFYRLPAADMAVVGGRAKSTNRALYSIIHHHERSGLKDELSGEGVQVLRKFLKDFHMYTEKALTMKTGELLYDFLEYSGFLKQVVDGEVPEGEDVARNLARFFSHVRAFGRATRTDDIRSFSEHLNRLHDLGEDSFLPDPEPDENKVRVMTVHKAKGLEFPVVFLPGLIQNQFPDRDRQPAFDLPDALLKETALPASDQKQEERRLFYVALTRAKDRVYLTSAEDYGTTKKRKISQFILEALDLEKETVEAAQASPIETIRLSAAPPPPPAATPLLAINLKPLEPDHLIELSYVQIDNLQTCPLKYKISHVLRVPLRATHHLVFGRALHEAIEVLLRMKKDGMLPFFSAVINEYNRAWVSEGFLSREHEEQRKEDGRRILQKFYDREMQDSSLPFLIEQDFSFKHKRVRVRGRWDRVDFDGDKKAVIIDYKSSAVEEQQEADKRARESAQLYIYAMAFEQRFGVWPEAMELRFLESGLTGRVDFRTEELSRVTAMIDSAAETIRKRDFPPRPAYQSCRFCQVRSICSYSAY